MNLKKKILLLQYLYLIVPFFVHFSGISGKFGRAVVCILARCSWTKIPIARLTEPDMPPKHTKKVWLGTYRTQIWPSEHDIIAISSQWLDIAGYHDSRRGLWLATSKCVRRGLNSFLVEKFSRQLIFFFLSNLTLSYSETAGKKTQACLQKFQSKVLKHHHFRITWAPCLECMLCDNIFLLMCMWL